MSVCCVCALSPHVRKSVSTASWIAESHLATVTSQKVIPVLDDVVVWAISRVSAASCHSILVDMRHNKS